MDGSVHCQINLWAVLLVLICLHHSNLNLVDSLTVFFSLTQSFEWDTSSVQLLRNETVQTCNRVRFEDHLYLCSRVFLDFLCMDGDEVSNATMCLTTQCTTCWCPDAQSSDPDAVFPFRNTEEVRVKVAEERRRLHDRDGTPRDRCKAEVCYIRRSEVNRDM